MVLRNTRISTWLSRTVTIVLFYKAVIRVAVSLVVLETPRILAVLRSKPRWGVGHFYAHRVSETDILVSVENVVNNPWILVSSNTYYGGRDLSPNL